MREKTLDTYLNLCSLRQEESKNGVYVNLVGNRINILDILNSSYFIGFVEGYEAKPHMYLSIYCKPLEEGGKEREELLKDKGTEFFKDFFSYNAGFWFGRSYRTVNLV